MILHAGILSLLAGSVGVLFLMAAASAAGWQILRHWDYESSSALQLSLERKTYLVSTVANYGLGFSILSLFLFVRTADDLHGVLVGAMCATGSLNANPVGWYVLGLKLALVFAAGIWIAFNQMDQRAEDYPLVPGKYRALIALTPLVLLDFALQLRYFLGIHPDVITSCCGSLFTEGADTLASSLSGLPPIPTLWGLYVGSALFVGLGILRLRRPGPATTLLFSTSAPLVFALSVAAIVSAVSLYIYGIPTHHCPFDFFQREYLYVGYPIYGLLISGTLFGILPGASQPLEKVPSIGPHVTRAQQTWTLASIGCHILFIALVTYPVIFGDLRLTGY